ncbi:hypothetical protein D3C84_722780 [compost metagenome]
MAGHEVVGHVACLGSGREHHGHRRVGEDELEQQLRPGGGVDLDRPVRQRLALDPGEQLAALERPVDQGGDAAVGTVGQQALLGVALGHRIVELDEIHRLLGQHREQVVVGRFAVMGDADVAHPALLLQLAQQSQLGAGVLQVVHLQQIELVALQGA